MPDSPRLEELRRRVERDPASIAFAQLAEEHRRAGDYREAIQVARTGLSQHAGYLSARVTLGRALIDVGQLDDAERELAQVLLVAPDNLAAIRALADIRQRREVLLPPAATPVASPVVETASSPTLQHLDALPDPVFTKLESWLAAIVADRERRRAVEAHPADLDEAGRPFLGRQI